MTEKSSRLKKTSLITYYLSLCLLTVLTLTLAVVLVISCMQLLVLSASSPITTTFSGILFPGF